MKTHSGRDWCKGDNNNPKNDILRQPIVLYTNIKNQCVAPIIQAVVIKVNKVFIIVQEEDEEGTDCIVSRFTFHVMVIKLKL